MADSNKATKKARVDPDPRVILPDDEMGTLVAVRWKAAKDWRKDKEDQWQRWYELYRSYAERKNWSEVSLFIPLIFSTIESFIPRMATQRPKIVVEARGDEDRQASTYHRKLLNYQWDLLGMGIKIMDWAKESLIYGTGILKVGWEKQEKVVTYRDSLDPNTPITETRVTRSSPRVDVVPLERFYPSPGARCVDSAAYTIELHRWTWDVIDSLGEQGFLKKDGVASLKERAHVYPERCGGKPGRDRTVYELWSGGPRAGQEGSGDLGV